MPKKIKPPISVEGVHILQQTINWVKYVVFFRDSTGEMFQVEDYQLLEKLKRTADD